MDFNPFPENEPPSIIPPALPFIQPKTAAGPRKVFQPLETFFPIIGKLPKIFSNHWKNPAIFSNHWKTFFQSLENFRRMETAAGDVFGLSSVCGGIILPRQ
jgi:hypothetical protein